MNHPSFLPILTACAFLLGACDKPKVAAPPPPPGSNGIFSDSGPTTAVSRLRAYSARVENQLKDGDASKNDALLAEGTNLLMETRSHAASVKGAEVPQFLEKVEECLKSAETLAKSSSPAVAEPFSENVASLRQVFTSMGSATGTLRALAGADLEKLAPAPESSRANYQKTYDSAPRGSEAYGSNRKQPGLSAPPTTQRPESPQQTFSPAPEEKTPPVEVPGAAPAEPSPAVK